MTVCERERERDREREREGERGVGRKKERPLAFLQSPLSSLSHVIYISKGSTSF